MGKMRTHGHGSERGMVQWWRDDVADNGDSSHGGPEQEVIHWDRGPYWFFVQLQLNEAQGMGRGDPF